MINELRKLKNIIDVLGGTYYVDTTAEKVGPAGTINHYHLAMDALSYLFRKNTLHLGEPGFGKTTIAKLVASAFTSLPFDLYTRCQLQGHPEQTKNDLIGRPDYGELMGKREVVVWQKSLYLGVIILDEFNRLPAGKQSIMLNAIDTGVFTELNATLFDGERKPFFATANHPDDGTYNITRPMFDRFSLSMELGYQGVFGLEDIEEARKNQRLLCDNELSNQIELVLCDKQKSHEQKRAYLEEASTQFLLRLEKRVKDKVRLEKGKEKELYMLEHLTAAERESAKDAIAKIPLEPEALVFFHCIATEINHSPTYGSKRSCDPVDAATHAKNLAVSKIKNTMSPRAYSDIRDYAKGIAALMGHDKVTIDHIISVTPYVLGHRLEFTDDFKADGSNKGRLRGEMEGIDCTRRLLNGVDKNYKDAVMPYVQLIVWGIKNPGELSANQLKQFKELKQAFKENKIDHPLLKEVLAELLKHER